MKKVLILGASGSIGQNSLAIIQDHPETLSLAGIHIHQNKDFLEKVKKLYPSIPSLISSETKLPLKEAYAQLLEKAKPDIVINGIAGSSGLLPSLISLDYGLPLALANKESIVMGGDLLFTKAKKKGGAIIPVDSEHAALYHLIKGARKKDDIEELILTASGGPFLGKTAHALKDVSVKAALNHPTWKMGGKISIDSATLANKGLELIEAVYLFGFKESQVRVLIHPESLVHSLIRLNNGVLYAQLSKPDMREPIHAALSHPHIEPSSYGRLDLADKTLSFLNPDTETFPLLNYARLAAKKGGLYPLAFNASNELAVHAFLKGELGFLEIARVVEDILLKGDYSQSPKSLEEVLFFHQEILKASKKTIEKRQP